MASIPAGFCLGPYEIKQVLGRGALGVVYCARQASLDRDVAIKVLDPALARDEELVERFRREARTAAALRHPNIVTIHDTGFHDGWHYIAMELLNGCTLDKLSLPLKYPQATETVRQLAEALGYAHAEGVVHRDLKPANAIQADTGHVTLTDFGVARVVGQVGLTLGGGPIGTPEFMSPEQARGETADAASDVYSLGLLFWFLVTGRSPFLAENALATMYRQIHEPLPPLPGLIPPPIAAWVIRCSSKDPAERFPSGSAALEALADAFGASQAATLHPVGDLTPPDADREPADQEPADREPLDQVLQGELSVSEALAIHRDREGDIRRAFQREVTAMNLDVVRSTLLKAPGQTIRASFTFGALRRYVQASLDRGHVVASVWSGDGLMALFPSADDAAGAAIAILRGLDGFNTAESGLPDAVQLRIGLHSGPVLMTDTQRLGEVTSRTLDVAGKLQKDAAPNNVLMSAETFSQLSGKDHWVPHPGVAGVPGLLYALAGAPVSRPILRSPDLPAGMTAARAGTQGIPIPPVPEPGALATLVGSHVLPENLPRSLAPLQPSSIVGPVTAWAGMFSLAFFMALAFQNPVAIIVFAITIALAGRTIAAGFRPGSAALMLTIGTMVAMMSMLRPGGGVPDWLPLCWLAGMGVAATAWAPAARQRILQARRQRVVLERLPPGSWELPEPARSRLLDDIARATRRMRLEPRQIGLRVEGEPMGSRLMLRAHAFDRDTGAVIALAEIQGDIDDTIGLAADVARQLEPQLWQARKSLRRRRRSLPPRSGPTPSPLPPGKRQ